MLLPIELLGAIVNTLALPAHCQAYGFEPDVLRSLVWLCSSSTTLYNITSPYLYSSVIISRSNHFHSFVDTLCNKKDRLAPALHSLSLRDFDDTSDDACVIELIKLLEHSPNLRRLIIDRDLWKGLYPDDYIYFSDSSSEENSEPRGFGPETIAKHRTEIRSGMDALQCLEELHSIQDRLRSVETDGTWDGWKNHLQLRYLSLYNPVIDSNLARDIVPLHFLQCLVLVRPGVNDASIEFFQAVMARSRVVLVGPMLCTIADIRETVIAARPACEIVYIEAPTDGSHCLPASCFRDSHILPMIGHSVDIRQVQLWVREQLERGTIFSEKGTIIWPRNEEQCNINI